MFSFHLLKNEFDGEMKMERQNGIPANQLDGPLTRRTRVRADCSDPTWVGHVRFDSPGPRLFQRPLICVSLEMELYQLDTRRIDEKFPVR